MSQSKHAIKKSLEAAMMQRGWPIQSYLRLPPAFLRGQPVTPYFFNSYVRRRPDDSYMLDGAIGVIHQEFEKTWLCQAATASDANRFCVVLDITNLARVDFARALKVAELQAGIERFANTICDVLEGMPKNESELSDSFKKGSLSGIALERFSGFSERKKFNALLRYVEELSAPRLH